MSNPQASSSFDPGSLPEGGFLDGQVVTITKATIGIQSYGNDNAESGSSSVGLFLTFTADGNEFKPEFYSGGSAATHEVTNDGLSMNPLPTKQTLFGKFIVALKDAGFDFGKAGDTKLINFLEGTQVRLASKAYSKGDSGKTGTKAFPDKVIVAPYDKKAGGSAPASPAPKAKAAAANTGTAAATAPAPAKKELTDEQKGEVRNTVSAYITEQAYGSEGKGYEKKGLVPHFTKTMFPGADNYAERAYAVSLVTNKEFLSGIEGITFDGVKFTVTE